MKINSKYISIPPFISTPMNNVLSIQMDKNSLVICLKSGAQVTLSNLPSSIIESVFKAHEEFMENGSQSNSLSLESLGVNFNPLSGGILDGIENINGMMHHDGSQKDAPNLPSDMITKISTMAKALGLDKGAFTLPEAEKHCNCPFCQVTRALHGEPFLKEVETLQEEVIPEDELKFREWDIEELAEKLYQVTNPFDKTEKYQVHLKTPVGCTCGKSNCEHILAVLNT